MLEIFGWGSDPVGPNTTPEQDVSQREETIDPVSTPVDDVWPEADVCWGSLVGAGFGSGYLVGINVI